VRSTVNCWVGPVGLEPTTRGFPQPLPGPCPLVPNVLVDLQICRIRHAVRPCRLPLIPVEDHGVSNGLPRMFTPSSEDHSQPETPRGEAHGSSWSAGLASPRGATKQWMANRAAQCLKRRLHGGVLRWRDHPIHEFAHVDLNA
jgi:hypothetical protein